MRDGFDDLDSGGELDMEEDPDFPLPHSSDSDASEGESDERLPRDPGPSESDEESPR